MGTKIFKGINNKVISLVSLLFRTIVLHVYIKCYPMRKKTNKGKNSAAGGKYDHLPFVSICTPTFNRRPFWPMAIQCFQAYTYPKERMEWIIVDDGSDSIEDLVKDIPQVKYYREEKQMILGRKRNYMHDKSKGDIIIYQDDDDYYPPERVSHAVERLMADPNVLAGGSSTLFLYFKHIQQMYRFGPYGPTHATAGTFAFKRELLKQTRYDDFKALAEEKSFLKDYTIPFVQFDPLKTILVFSHNHNTFDKKELLDRGDGPTQQPDKNITVGHFMKEEGEIYDFFMKNIDGLLAEYKPGAVENKPEVLQQMKTMNDYREKEQMELIEIRKKAMLDEEVEKLIAHVKEEKEETHKKYMALAMVNMKMIKKMKLLNEKVKSIDIDDETQSLIKRVESEGIQVDLEVKNFTIDIVQKDELCNIDPQSVHNILEFVRRGATVSGSVILNGNTQYDIENQKAQVAYRPHPSKQQDIPILQELSRQAAGTVQQQPYNSQNIGKQVELSSEDINTVMEQGECNEPTAKKALYNENNDVISAIMNIENYTCDSFEIPSPTTQNQPMAPAQMLESVDKDDVNTVMEQAECNEITARNALAHEDGDVITAIMNIDKYTCSDNASTGSDNNTNDEKVIHLNREDIQTVMAQAKCDEETAIKAFVGESQDIVSAVMNIDKYMITAENNIIQSSTKDTVDFKLFDQPDNNDKSKDTVESEFSKVMNQPDYDDKSVDVKGLTGPQRKIILDIKFLQQYHKIPHHVAKIAYYNEGRDLAKALNNYKKYEHCTLIDRADHPNNIGQVMLTTKCNVETSKKAVIDTDGNIGQAAMDIFYNKDITVPTPEDIDVCNQEYIDVVRSITLCSEETAKNALTKTNGDVLHCITDENISEYVVDETETEPIEMVMEEESSIASDRA